MGKKSIAIAHISDIHIRFAIRHEEYREVFKRLFGDLKKQKPDRIVITGDLNHLKVNMSPGSIDLSSEFLINLAKIAPTDVILGNHDLNLQQKEQGDTINPILDIANKFYDLANPTSKKNNRVAFIVSAQNKDNIDFSKKAIYLFPDSDFYKISDTLVYGVFSCKDNKMLTLTKKEPGVKYVALYHGQVAGARLDNGYEATGDSLLNINSFNNFDVVMLGDIHEFQAFRDDESAAYAGSILQNDYGESIDKGYLLWDLETNSFQRKYILNDYGFAKITIARGELIEERIENIKFSNNKKQTKVYIVWEDYEQNYSIEKENQIAKLVKEKYGCDVVKVEFSEMKKTQLDNEDVADSLNQETYLQQVENYLKETSPEEDTEIIKEVLKLAEFIDKELEIIDKPKDVKLWDVDSVEISNLFSFPEKPIIINLEKLIGVTGIFGKNYTGKSNIVKAIVWGLYQHILGGNSEDSKKIVNIYTSSNKGYIKIHLKIDGEKYYIKRTVITTVKKDGTSSNEYPVEFRRLIIDDDGKEKWVPEISDKKANTKVEVKTIILETISTVENFTKICLQAQGGKDDYVNQSQQPKNDLVNSFIGLEPFRLRYDYGNKEFNDVKKKQKELGDIAQLQSTVMGIETTIAQLQSEYNALIFEKTNSEKSKDAKDEEILKLSKKLKNYIPLNRDEIDNEEEILENIATLESQLIIDEQTYQELLEWVSVNFKRELPFDENETIEKLDRDFTKEDAEYKKETKQYYELRDWLAANPPRQLSDVQGFDLVIQNLRLEIDRLKAKLPTYKGEQCPTCGHVTLQPDVQMYEECLIDISNQTGVLNSHIVALDRYNKDLTHNNGYEFKNSNLQRLFATLTVRKERKEAIIKKRELILQSQNILIHNQTVEEKNSATRTIKSSMDYKAKLIEALKVNLEKVKEIDICKKHNFSIEQQIAKLQEESKAYKFSIYGMSQQITNKNGDIRVEKNNLENFQNRLEEVKNAEKMYKKYSLYLQAVHRDGIPAKIIRRKLPIINNKINSILSTIVNFKIEMSVTPKGNVVEGFYYSKDKSDMLPLSAASGAQKFISSVVIKDALHYMSSLIKPSLNIIDEGFGTLDDDLISGIVTVIQYLKNKYRNVIVITHRNEIKDSTNNIIETYKSIENIPQEFLDVNEHAGITQINIS